MQQELHRRNTKKIHSKKRRAPNSAFTDHVIKTNHDIAWDEAIILKTNNNWQQRKILNAWELNGSKDILNRDDGALLAEYLHLILVNKQKRH